MQRGRNRNTSEDPQKYSNRGAALRQSPLCEIQNFRQRKKNNNREGQYNNSLELTSSLRKSTSPLRTRESIDKRSLDVSYENNREDISKKYRRQQMQQQYIDEKKSSGSVQSRSNNNNKLKKHGSRYKFTDQSDSQQRPALDMKQLDNQEIYDISRTTISNTVTGGGGGYRASRANNARDEIEQSKSNEKNKYRRDFSIEKSCDFSPNMLLGKNEKLQVSQQQSIKNSNHQQSASQSEWYKKQFTKINKKYFENGGQNSSVSPRTSTSKYPNRQSQQQQQQQQQQYSRLNNDTFDSFQRTFKAGQNSTTTGYRQHDRSYSSEQKYARSKYKETKQFNDSQIDPDLSYSRSKNIAPLRDSRISSDRERSLPLKSKREEFQNNSMIQIRDDELDKKYYQKSNKGDDNDDILPHPPFSLIQDHKYTCNQGTSPSPYKTIQNNIKRNNNYITASSNSNQQNYQSQSPSLANIPSSYNIYTQPQQSNQNNKIYGTTTTSFQKNIENDTANRFASINSVDEYRQLASQPVFQGRRLSNNSKHKVFGLNHSTTNSEIDKSLLTLQNDIRVLRDNMNQQMDQSCEMMVYQPKLEEKVSRIQKCLDKEMQGVRGQGDKSITSNKKQLTICTQKDRENAILKLKMQEVKDQLQQNLQSARANAISRQGGVMNQNSTSKFGSIASHSREFSMKSSSPKREEQDQVLIQPLKEQTTLTRARQYRKELEDQMGLGRGKVFRHNRSENAFDSLHSNLSTPTFIQFPSSQTNRLKVRNQFNKISPLDMELDPHSRVLQPKGLSQTAKLSNIHSVTANLIQQENTPPQLNYDLDSVRDNSSSKLPNRFLETQTQMISNRNTMHMRERIGQLAAQNDSLHFNIECLKQNQEQYRSRIEKLEKEIVDQKRINQPGNGDKAPIQKSYIKTRYSNSNKQAIYNTIKTLQKLDETQKKLKRIQFKNLRTPKSNPKPIKKFPEQSLQQSIDDRQNMPMTLRCESSHLSTAQTLRPNTPLDPFAEEKIAKIGGIIQQQEHQQGDSSRGQRTISSKKNSKRQYSNSSQKYTQTSKRFQGQHLRQRSGSKRKCDACIQIEGRQNLKKCSSFKNFPKLPRRVHPPPQNNRLEQQMKNVNFNSKYMVSQSVMHHNHHNEQPSISSQLGRKMMDFLGEERQELNSIRRSMNFYRADLSDQLSAEVEKLHSVYQEELDRERADKQLYQQKFNNLKIKMQQLTSSS